MTSPADMHRGLALRSYLAASHLIAPAAKPVLRRRLQRGKEHPTRWQEKMGWNLAPRPDGPLIWLHAVGLGEVLSLRGLIARLGQKRPDLSFLVTSTTATSAEVFAKNAPPRTTHQFLPLDAPAFRRRFLDRFRPDLCVWVEQDLWPGMVSDLAKRQVPQCMVAARMNAASFRAHQRAAGLYRDLYSAMAMITAQDDATAAHLASLGAEVKVTGSLKPAAPLLACDMAELDRLQKTLSQRTIWAVAPAHRDDIARARAAHQKLCDTDPTALLIIAPRLPQDAIEELGPRRSKGEVPATGDAVWLCDTFGDLGLIYRLAQTVLIGGTFGDIEGHNPWEAAALGCAILHGPRVANFRTDYAQLTDASGAIAVTTVDDIAAAVISGDLPQIAENAGQAIRTASAHTDALAADLLDLFDRTRAT
ncbi:3-deoxy-D-manno-octulosonic acid transferase [Loktanella sp. 5RATIMAR09]|uniref:3-deoxy-D-manno-octulosonic acid transferase n=1 Tax=Loktanella sp. 5RATIMAR09 TaxID=1225655 RepID=UPI0006EB5265|nr:glycosyltransferase N-terminal domain-containing protein [Loktanella sp. 5RATIMAR09]KQI71204.1 3-deoxy-D-manno-octulosonic acid transferase [Loktanella sp. 5RATIMAR09]